MRNGPPNIIALSESQSNRGEADGLVGDCTKGDLVPLWREPRPARLKFLFSIRLMAIESNLGIRAGNGIMSVFALLFLVAPVAQVEPSQVANERRQAYADELVRSLELTNRATAYSRHQQPILRWSNLRNGYVGGELQVWLLDDRPVAISGIFFWPANDAAYTEVVKLTNGPIVARRDKRDVWLSSDPAIRWALLSEAGNPGSTRPRRLRQMRDLAAQVETEAIKQPPAYEPNSVWQLRLLTQPLFRYQSERHGVVDGAIFAFGMETDPELLMSLEARKRADGTLGWYYAFSRMCDWQMHARYNDRLIWSIERIYETHNPGRSYYRSKPIPFEANVETKPNN